jgi:hypothetical protein
MSYTELFEVYLTLLHFISKLFNGSNLLHWSVLLASLTYIPFSPPPMTVKKLWKRESL